MENLIKAMNQFETIKNTPSTNDKKKLLAKYGEDRLFIKLLDLTLNTNITTGISKAKINKQVKTVPTVELCNIYDTIDYIKVHNSGKDEDIANIQAYIQTLPGDIQGFYKEIFSKSYKLGANSKLVNSVITGLIPTFECMLGSPYDKNIKYVKGKEFILTTKLDGSRILVVVNKGTVRFFTRQGKLMEGLIELEQEFKKLPDGVYDGELLAAQTYNNNKEQFAATMQLSRIKGAKTGLKVVLYDYIDNVDDFFSQKNNMKCIDRKNKLKYILEQLNMELVEYLEPLYVGNDISVIDTYMNQAKNNGDEGLMLNIEDSKYQYKRTKELLKVKVFSDCDLLCLRVEEGDGRLKNTLGAIVCEYKGNEVKVGTGFSDKERKEIFDNPDMVIGKIVTINYFEESSDKDGNLSLRFPSWTSNIRFDKTEPSYN